uniref:Uncharacterized protein n=1 Tax=Anopheles albimanus TaxID=7167 RepID=A0A182FY88_ANOAL
MVFGNITWLSARSVGEDGVCVRARPCVCRPVQKGAGGVFVFIFVFSVALVVCSVPWVYAGDADVVRS